jgi:hypothetical protein
MVASDFMEEYIFQKEGLIKRPEIYQRGWKWGMLQYQEGE